jgi:hypothetical protein
MASPARKVEILSEASLHSGFASGARCMACLEGGDENGRFHGWKYRRLRFAAAICIGRILLYLTELTAARVWS